MIARIVSQDGKYNYPYQYIALQRNGVFLYGLNMQTNERFLLGDYTKAVYSDRVMQEILKVDMDTERTVYQVPKNEEMVEEVEK